MPAHPFGDMGEIRWWVFEVHTDIGPPRIGAALWRHMYLMGPIIVVSPIVIHYHQHRDVVFDRHPERAQVKHQIAVRLEIDHELARSLVRQGNSDGHANLRAGAE